MTVSGATMQWGPGSVSTTLNSTPLMLPLTKKMSPGNTGKTSSHTEGRIRVTSAAEEFQYLDGRAGKTPGSTVWGKRQRGFQTGPQWCHLLGGHGSVSHTWYQGRHEYCYKKTHRHPGHFIYCRQTSHVTPYQGRITMLAWVQTCKSLPQLSIEAKHKYIILNLFMFSISVIVWSF